MEITWNLFVVCAPAVCNGIEILWRQTIIVDVVGAVSATLYCSAFVFLFFVFVIWIFCSSGYKYGGLSVCFFFFSFRCSCGWAALVPTK